MATHIVTPGECLASIAERFGFSDPLIIYNHPDNAELRQRRPDPNVLLPGDQVVVPERVPRIDELATERRHRFVVKRPLTFLRLRLQDVAGKPRKGVPYQVEFLGRKLKGTTDSAGRIEQVVPRDLTLAVVTIGSGAAKEVLRVALGHLDPVDSDSGLRQRLTNLGVLVPLARFPDATALRFAIHTFQLRAGLNATGLADTATRKKLLEMHGS